MRRIHLRMFITALTAAVGALAQVPSLINYQGRLSVGGTNLFSGAGQFKFALVSNSPDATYWSNDGTSSAGSEPTQAIPLFVNQGLFSINLGDTSLSNMTVVVAPPILANADLRLRSWFSDGVSAFQQSYPDQRLTSDGYAMLAANVVDGAITSSKLAEAAVGGNAVAANAIGSANIAAGAITTTNLADGAVTASKLASEVASGFQNSMLVFSNSGTWTKPPGVIRVHAKLWGEAKAGCIARRRFSSEARGGCLW